MPDVLPTTPELHAAATRSELAQVYVAMPGTVISYDADKQTAKICPGVVRIVLDEESNQIEEVIPPFENVPVIWLRCAAFSIHAELATGDKVRLLFNSDSTAEWRQGQLDQIAPGDLKRLGLSYPTCDPGFYPNNAPGPDTDTSMGKPGGLRIHFAAGAISIGNGSDFVAMAMKVVAAFNELKAAVTSAAATESGAGGLGGMAALLSALSAWPPAAGVASTDLKAD